MSTKIKNNHLIHAKCLLEHQETEMLWFFCDEKIFDQDEKVNQRNDKWISRVSKDILTCKVSSNCHGSGSCEQQGRCPSSLLLSTRLKGQCC